MKLSNVRLENSLFSVRADAEYLQRENVHAFLLLDSAAVRTGVHFDLLLASADAAVLPSAGARKMRPVIFICRFLQSTHELLVSMARNRNKPDPKRAEVANFVSTVYGTDGALLMRMIEHKYGWCRRVFAAVKNLLQAIFSPVVLRTPCSKM